MTKVINIGYAIQQRGRLLHFKEDHSSSMMVAIFISKREAERVARMRTKSFRHPNTVVKINLKRA